MKQLFQKLCPLILLLLWTPSLNAQSTEQLRYDTPEDEIIFQRYITQMQSKRNLPMGELMIQTALFFEGTPYVASTLEREPEGLVVNLRELDCTTFMETVLALSRTLKGQEQTFEAYCDNLQTLRYRQGTITDYTDRLHYMTDWFYENERKGLVKDIAASLGGIPFTLDLSFISTHPDSYKPLKGHPELVRKMKQKEQEINQRPHSYVPKSKINTLAKGFKNGDILCFVTSIQGLDVTHVALAYWQEGELCFIHASSSAMKVVVEKRTLQDFAEAIKSCKGVLVARATSF